jgi:two-component system, response regulator PdtaR
VTSLATMKGSAAKELVVEIFDPADYDSTASVGVRAASRRGSGLALAGGMVMVVAADDLLRLVIADTLRFAGIGVLQAENAWRASALMRGREDIGIVLADVGGQSFVDDLDLAWRCSVDFPDIPLVIMSAMLEPDSLEIPPSAIFMRKPFTPDLLIQVVRPLLAVQEREGRTSLSSSA